MSRRRAAVPPPTSPAVRARRRRRARLPPVARMHTVARFCAENGCSSDLASCTPSGLGGGFSCTRSQQGCSLRQPAPPGAPRCPRAHNRMRVGARARAPWAQAAARTPAAGLAPLAARAQQRAVVPPHTSPAVRVPARPFGSARRGRFVLRLTQVRPCTCLCAGAEGVHGLAQSACDTLGDAMSVDVGVPRQAVVNSDGIAAAEEVASGAPGGQPRPALRLKYQFCGLCIHRLPRALWLKCASYVRNGQARKARQRRCGALFARSGYLRLHQLQRMHPC